MIRALVDLLKKDITESRQLLQATVDDLDKISESPDVPEDKRKKADADISAVEDAISMLSDAIAALEDTVDE